MNCLIIFAKNPDTVPVKTRLAKSIGKEKAKAHYQEWLHDLITHNQHQSYDLVVYTLGGTSYFKQYDVRTRGQTGKDLGKSMQDALAHELKKYKKAILIGSDLPGLGPEVITHAFKQLDNADIVLGPAKDGGYYLVGMGKIHNIFGLEQWSHDRVLEQTLSLAKKKNLSYKLLAARRDIDTVEDLPTEVYGVVAKVYDLIDWYWESTRYRHIRPKVWAQAKGKVLDAGVGTGRNIPHYQGDVYAIDNSGSMLKRAKQRAKKHKKKIHFSNQDVTNLGFPDNYFDTVVATFVLCVLSAEQERKAIAEFKRVLKKNGRLLILHYQYSQNPLRRAIQQVFAPLIRLVFHARLNNPTMDHLKRCFRVDNREALHSDTLFLVSAIKS